MFGFNPHVNFRIRLVLIGVLGSIAMSYRPPDFDPNAKLKALFIMNFTRYFEWPEAKKSGDFVIYLIGQNASLTNDLKALAQKKKVGAQNIIVVNHTKMEKNQLAHMIYFTNELELQPISDAASKLRNKGVLLISEKPDACRSGSCVNFIYLENKLKFEYSYSNAVKTGLKTNDDFKTLAATVIN